MIYYDFVYYAIRYKYVQFWVILPGETKRRGK